MPGGYRKKDALSFSETRRHTSLERKPLRACIYYMYSTHIKNVKQNPVQAWTDPEGFRRLRFPDFKKMFKSRLQGYHPPPPQGNIPGTHFCQRLSRPQGHSAARKIESMNTSNDTMGDRTRDLPACDAVPQPTAPPPAPYVYTGCPRRNVPDFGRVFLMLKYTDITQNTYIQS